MSYGSYTAARLGVMTFGLEVPHDGNHTGRLAQLIEEASKKSTEELQRNEERKRLEVRRNICEEAWKTHERNLCATTDPRSDDSMESFYAICPTAAVDTVNSYRTRTSSLESLIDILFRDYVDYRAVLNDVNGLTSSEAHCRVIREHLLRTADGIAKED